MDARNNTQEFVISRVFDAPRDLVWQAFTDPERMKQWWGPKGVTVVHSITCGAEHDCSIKHCGKRLAHEVIEMISLIIGHFCGAARVEDHAAGLW